MAIADPTKAQVLIPDAYLIAIGKVTVIWNVLELILEMMIGKLDASINATIRRG